MSRKWIAGLVALVGVAGMGFAAGAALSGTDSTPHYTPLTIDLSKGKSVSARAGAMVVDRLAARDRHHPGTRMDAVHAVVCLQCCDERFLEAVLGVVVADHRPQESEHGPAMGVEELLKRGPVRGAGAHCVCS